MFTKGFIKTQSLNISYILYSITMSTTIAVRKETVEMLKTVKEELQIETFDETIRRLILKAKKPKKSYKGLAKHTPEFVREEIDRFA